MQQIVSISPIPEYFSLTWMLGSFCNYDCMYCPSELHDSSSRPHDLDQMKTVWKNVYEKTAHKNLKYKISFTGGEVTANRNFLPLVKWLKNNYPQIDKIDLTTNGSASQRYYMDLCQYVSNISFSTHSEFMDEKKFFTTVKAVDQIMTRPKKSLHVNVMDERWNQSRIEIYKQWLEENKISYSINAIDYSRAVRTNILNQGRQNLEF